MLKAVGLPIVMANASDDLKKIGKVITKSNTEDGVAYGIQNILLTAFFKFIFKNKKICQ